VAIINIEDNFNVIWPIFLASSS